MRSKGLLIGGIVLVAIAGIAVWAGRDAYATARIGTTYVAKQTCSCLFVARRSSDSCQSDYNPSDLEPLTVRPTSNSVSVSALAGLVSARAEYEEGYGCHPVD
jgi:hypothetical protein